MDIRSRNREACRKFHKANPGKRRLSQIKYLYGLDITTYHELIKRQGNKCAICRTTEPGSNRKHWAVDHDHKTGTIRGLLCNRCNLGLGCFSDDIERLKAAQNYLEST